MRIVRELPPEVAGPLTALPQEAGLGPLVGVAQVNTADPNKSWPPAVVISIALSALAVGMTIAQGITSRTTFGAVLALVAAVVYLGTVIVGSVYIARRGYRGDEYVAVHEGGLAFAATGRAQPFALRFARTEVKLRSGMNRRHWAGDAPQFRTARLRSADARLVLYAATIEEHQALDAILTRIPNAR